MFVMSRDWLEVRFFGRFEWLAMLPCVLDERKNPELAVGIPHNPLLSRPIHENCCHSFPGRFHFCLLPIEAPISFFCTLGEQANSI